MRREPIETEISERRHEMFSALVLVLEGYLELRRKYVPTPNPIPEFEEHFTTLCYLLRAYGSVVGKPEGWAEQIISVWSKTLDKKDGDGVEGGELEESILYVLTNPKNFVDVETYPYELNGIKGTLYVTEAMPLLLALRNAAFLQAAQLTAVPLLPDGDGPRRNRFTIRIGPCLRQVHALPLKAANLRHVHRGEDRNEGDRRSGARYGPADL